MGFQVTNADSILNVARLQYIYEKPDKAIVIGHSIYSHAKEVDVKIKALILISTAYSSKRDYQNSLSYIMEAKALLSKTQSVYLQVVVLTKIGELYHQIRVYDKAIYFLDKAEQICRSFPEMTTWKKFQLGSNYLIKGFIYKNRLSCDIAISFFKKGVNLYRQIEKSGAELNRSIAQYNMGNCFILLSDYTSAIKSFKKAYQIAKELDANSLEAFAHKGLASVYTLQGHYQPAIKLLQNALVISKGVGDIILYREIYLGLSENYLAIKNREAYQKYNTLYQDYQLQVKQTKRKSIGKSIDTLVQQRILESKHQKNNFEGLISCLIFGLVLMMIFSTILIRKQNYVVKETRKKISDKQKIIKK